MLDGDNGLILTCLYITPIAFIISIIKDYHTDKGSKYDVSFIKLSDTQKYLFVLGNSVQKLFVHKLIIPRADLFHNSKMDQQVQ